MSVDGDPENLQVVLSILVEFQLYENMDDIMYMKIFYYFITKQNTGLIDHETNWTFQVLTALKCTLDMLLIQKQNTCRIYNSGPEEFSNKLIQVIVFQYLFCNDYNVRMFLYSGVIKLILAQKLLDPEIYTAFLLMGVANIKSSISDQSLNEFTDLINYFITKLLRTKEGTKCAVDALLLCFSILTEKKVVTGVEGTRTARKKN